MNQPDRLTIITHRYAGSMCDQILQDLAAFFGINVETFDLDKFSMQEILDAMRKQPRPCAAIAATSLVHLNTEQRLQLKRFVERTDHAILLIHSVFPDVARSIAWLRDFIEADVSVNPPPEGLAPECHFSKKRPEFTGSLTGACVGAMDPESDYILHIGRGRSLPLPLMTPGVAKVGGEMIFGQIRVGDGAVFILSSHPPGEDYLKEGLAAWLTPARAAKALPLAVFIRGVFGQSCWHNPAPRCAFVWPDARIAQRVSDTDLRDVAEEVFRLEQSLCLAVPPAEFGRFDPIGAKILRQYLNHLSVVAYGNLGEPDELALPFDKSMRGSVAPAPQAARRMNELASHAKIGWSKAMIAPGGMWDSSHLPDLKRAGFRMLAGRLGGEDVSGPARMLHGMDPAWLDAGTPDDLSGAYHLPVVPVISEGGAEMALINHFLGRPTLIELNPQWFAEERAGQAPPIMETLASLESKPVWGSLDDVSRSLFLMRRGIPMGGPQTPVVEIRLFSDEVVVENVNVAEDAIEIIPPRRSDQSFERLALEGAREGQWTRCRSGRTRFEIVDENTLRIEMKREPADLSDIPLGPSGVGAMERVSHFVKSLSGRFRRGGG